MTFPTSAVAAASQKVPAPRSRPEAILPGVRVRWMGRIWHVDRTYYHPRWGHYFACTAEDDGSYELINLNGNDGGIEILVGGE